MVLENVLELLGGEIVISVISFIMTIWIIWKQNTINRKVNKMIKLSDQEIQLIENIRLLKKETQLTIYDYIEDEIETIAKEVVTKEKEEDEEAAELKIMQDAVIKVKEAITTYKEVKEALTMLKKNKDKYQFSEEIERIINNDNE